jgi:sugar lactone lactonase YvrE
MRTCALALLSALIPLTMVAAQAPAPAPSANCAPAAGVRFVCGQSGPEDLVAVPGNAWLIASAFGPAGGLNLIDVKAASSRRLYPDPNVPERLDRKTYDTCPGPIPAADRQRFGTHGLYLKPGSNRVHTLYVVHHGSREAVEVFELDARGQTPSLVWVGCAVAPGDVGLNSVVALPEGGFAATNFQPRTAASTGLGEKLLAGEQNGEVWEWHTSTGWQKVPGSETAGANGIELSDDGKWYYVSQWGNRSFLRLSRGEKPVKREQIPLGFRVDNVRWAPDGTLLVAGQGGSDNAIFGRGQTGKPDVPTSVIGKVDPKSMTYRQLISVPTTPVISPATVALQIGNELWTGAFNGDRLVIYPAAGLAK